MKWYKASVKISGIGGTEGDAIEQLANELFELDCRIAAGEKPMNIKIEECEIDEEE